jgi:hypothetical protein
MTTADSGWTAHFPPLVPAGPIPSNMQQGRPEVSVVNTTDSDRPLFLTGKSALNAV